MAQLRVSVRIDGAAAVDVGIDERCEPDRLARIVDRRDAEQLARLRGSKMRIVDKRSAYWVLTDRAASDGKLLSELKSVLQPR